MSRARSWIAYGALLAVALALGLATQGAPPTSRVPSIDNPGPLGLRALFLYLEESGARVVRIDGPLGGALAGLRTLVICAPTEQAVEADDVERIQAFVQSGGRLVFMAPPDFERAQPALTRWLKLFRPPETLRPDDLQSQLADVGGTTVPVWIAPGGARPIQGLRIAAGPAIASRTPTAAPAAGRGPAAAVLHWVIGDGEVWIFSGPDAAQNRRLERDDNLAFFASLAMGGPIAFDEHHHQAGADPALPPAFAAMFGQLLLATAAYAVAKGARFGAPRPEREERHRSILEYVGSMAWLIRRAQVEPELAAALVRSVRAALFDRASVPLAVSDAEAALQLEQRLRIPRGRTAETLQLLRRAADASRLSPRAYLRCSRAAAALMAEL